MSGHNKWSKIKHKKAATDAKKSKIFSKLAKMIQVEAKLCGGDTNSPGLRGAIEAANKANMPKANIERAIKKAIDSPDNLELVTYEAYGPGGCAIIVDALTENRNRTGAEIRHIFSKQGYELAAPGSASWAFTNTPGQGWSANQTVDLSDEDLEKLEKLVDLLEENDDTQEVYTNVE